MKNILNYTKSKLKSAAPKPKAVPKSVPKFAG